jgi:hypothetical protein
VRLMTRKPEPPKHSRFQKGQSGNPKGRPRKTQPSGSASAFDVIVDKMLTITRNGVPREVGIEEALQHRTYRDAIGGNRSARREVLKMIAKREQALAKLAPPPAYTITRAQEEDPDNANAALLILGIACRDPTDYGPRDTFERLLLEPWAVQAALSRRRGGSKLDKKDIEDIRRCTRDRGSLRWPRGTDG